ncbi:MAG: single-stranded DNA-binding protein [Clostridia bacterium]
MNKVILIGNLVKNPEISETNNGTAYCKFTVATTRRYQNAEGEKETDFTNVVVWKKLAELCGEYLAKGRKVAVVGELRTRSYEVDGSKRYISEVLADEVEFLTPRQEVEIKQSAPPSKNVRQSSFEDLQPVDDGDLPF